MLKLNHTADQNHDKQQVTQKSEGWCRGQTKWNTKSTIIFFDPKAIKNGQKQNKLKKKSSSDL